MTMPGLGAMRPGPPGDRAWARRVGVLAAIVAVAVVLAFALAGGPVRGLVTARVHAMAAAHGFDVAWTSMRVTPSLRASFTGLALTRRSDGALVLHADSLEARVKPWSLLTFSPRLSRVDLAGVAIRAAHESDADTLAPEEPRPRGRADDPARAAHVREVARSLVRLLTLPARDLPRVSLRDLTVSGRGGGDEEDDTGPDPSRLTLDRFTLDPDRSGVRIAAAGALVTDRRVPFTASLVYGRDDRLDGAALCVLEDAAGPETLRVTVAGALRQDRRAGRVTVVDPTRLAIGTLRFRLGGVLDLAGPSFDLAVDADSLTAAEWRESLPRAMLGPLTDLAVRGWWAWRLRLDLDVSRPDSMAFDARVVPHGLALDPERTRLPILGLDQPFVARIHLPRDRIVERDLSPANPHYRPLGAIDTLLTRAVLANEDGGFFHHQGFNLEAVRGAIADDIRAGAFRRGAGTITMQLVRNLYLGHRRTLSRKGQEVVLAWVLEHLTPLEKERMLEIYLNIIEWGPDVHGADEAAWYYLGHDAGHVSIAEALFLATVVPAPTRWRWRFDPDGGLRPFARAQMHFIGRAMAARGWLSADSLPPADSLRVEIRGPARALLDPAARSVANPF